MLVLQWETLWQRPNGWRRRNHQKRHIPKSKVKPDCGRYTQRFFWCWHFFVPSIITVYSPRSDEIVEPESIHQAPSILETLSIHKFVQQINGRGDSSIEFFKTVVDHEAFHTQWYKAADVVCGHYKSDKNDNACSTCWEWHTEDGSEWLRCPICEQWFHETCFYV